MVDPSHNGHMGGRIIASALWLPPQTRLAGWNIHTMIKADIIPVLTCLSLTGWQVRIPMF